MDQDNQSLPILETTGNIGFFFQGLLYSSRRIVSLQLPHNIFVYQFRPTLSLLHDTLCIIYFS
jgi:hypothetical protein